MSFEDVDPSKFHSIKDKDGITWLFIDGEWRRTSKMTNKEQTLREALATLCEDNGIEGHLLLYLDKGKIKMVGEMGADALAPMLPSLLRKLMKVE